MFSAPHRRLNRLTGESVLVSPHRTARPWQGHVEAHTAEQRPRYDPGCYLCPGNERAGGAHTPEYTSTFVFDNDFAALKPDTAPERFDRAGLLVADSERLICAACSGMTRSRNAGGATLDGRTVPEPRHAHGACPVDGDRFSGTIRIRSRRSREATVVTARPIR